MVVLLNRAKQIEQQKKSDSNKVYSMYAPEVECIAKGKAHKRYEFGCKVVLVTINVLLTAFGFNLRKLYRCCRDAAGTFATA